MKKIPVILSALVLFSCGKTGTPKASFINLFAIHLKPDSTHEFVTAGVQYMIDDTASNKKGKIIYKEFYGVRFFPILLDSAGKSKKDSLGNQLYDLSKPFYVPTSKDSLFILSDIPTDSLMKNGPFKK